jgi:xanthine dehydrogenase accessory factor
MEDVWTRIRETIERYSNAALVSVTAAAGSAPREPGARIVLQPDGAFFGTIGGGRLEYEVLAQARAVLAAGRDAAQFRDWPLGPNLGQCCGGMVTTLIETFDDSDLATVRQFEAREKSGIFTVASCVGDDGRIVRTPAEPAAVNSLKTGKSSKRRRGKLSFHEQFGKAAKQVLLFGAGHVGRALVLALAPLPFAVRWIDSRHDQFPQYVPRNVITVRTADIDLELVQAPSDSIVIVMTHSHPLDYDITVKALKRGTFDFVGLIGSQTKRARFTSLARQMGVADSTIDRLVCPIGLPQIKGKEPAVIAAGIAAQILMLAQDAETPAVCNAMQLA